MRSTRYGVMIAAGLLAMACGVPSLAQAPAQASAGDQQPMTGETQADGQARSGGPARSGGQAQAGGQARSGGPARGTGAAARRPTTPPYIVGDTSGLMAVLPPAPHNGDARDASDRRIFLETRKLEGTPRWEMAAADSQLGTAAMLKHFSCSLGVELKPEQAPKLVALAQKATRESASTVGRAKDFYKRERPFKVDEGPTCVPASTIGTSYDYPSGHTTAGWAWALVLAQVDPEHAVPILARGRAIGDSRVVCGMHNASAVEQARMITGAAMTMVTASKRYQSDLAGARTELGKLRKRPHVKPDPAQCAAEAELIKPYW